MQETREFEKFVWNKFSQLDADDLACLRYMPCEEDSYFSNKFFIVDCGCWEYFDVLCQKLDAQWWDNGATKIVFAFAEFPQFVVKIPFDGIANYDKNNHRIGCNGFLNNYCEREVTVFEEATLAGIGHFFCETQYMFTLGGTEFYCAEKCEKPFLDSPKVYSDNSYKKAEKRYYSNAKKPLNIDCLATMYEQYGVTATEELITFLEDNSVNDLHCGNFGFLDGMLCIIDYSGYYED